MIEASSIECYPDLQRFYNSLTSYNLNKYGQNLHQRQLYAVRQKFPLDTRVVHNYIELTMAFGGTGHVKYLIKRYGNEYLISQIQRLLILAIRNCNNLVYFFMFQTFNYSEYLTKLTSNLRPFEMKNCLIDLIEAAAIANNIEVLNALLTLDKSGYGALGAENNQILKHSPLYYAAVANSLHTFERLLQCKKVCKKFQENYTLFRSYIEHPSVELRDIFEKFKPKEKILTKSSLLTLGFISPLSLNSNEIKSKEANSTKTFNSSYISSPTEVSSDTREEINSPFFNLA